MKTILKSIEDVVKGKTLLPPLPNDFPDFSLKYASLDYAMKDMTDYVKNVINEMPLVGDRNNVVVDIKTHDLTENMIPALAFWHIDCVNNPLHPSREDHNHIFVSGTACLTEFLKDRVQIDIDEGEILDFDRILKYKDGKSIEGNTIYTYGRFVHRAVPSKSSHRRLLIRVTETDLIQPRNKTFQVTYRKAIK